MGKNFTIYIYLYEYVTFKLYLFIINRDNNMFEDVKFHQIQNVWINYNFIKIWHSQNILNTAGTDGNNA